MTEPAANTSVCSPPAPSSKFADDKTSAGFKHAGHFCHCALGILNKAKHSHRKNTVEALVIEWQSLRLSLDERQLSILDFRSPVRGGNHHGVCIETRDDSATSRKLRRQLSVTAANIQQCLAGDRAKQLKEQLLLQRVGDLAEPTRSPLGVGSSQFSCCVHQAIPTNRAPMQMVAGRAS